MALGTVLPGDTPNRKNVWVIAADPLNLPYVPLFYSLGYAKHIHGAKESVGQWHRSADLLKK